MARLIFIFALSGSASCGILHDAAHDGDKEYLDESLTAGHDIHEESVVGATPPSAPPPNMRPGLVPPSGGWRGSTLGWLDGPQQYVQQYGHQLHLWRTFKDPENLAITDDQKAFVDGGGILWYNMQPTNWSEAGSPSFAPTIASYAKAVKSLAPAKVIVNAGHEPDGHCDPSDGKYFGTPGEYRAMWAQFRAGFAAAGADNAVWAVDFSRGIRKKATFDRWVAALWPGDDAVDWLFFNAFGDHPMADKQGRGNWTTIVDSIYTQLEQNAADGNNYTAVPWGIGAFQPKPPPLMDEQDRSEFILQAATALNASRFPRLRGMVYYDHDESGMSASFRPVYRQYLSSPFFAVNG